MIPLLSASSSDEFFACFALFLLASWDASSALRFFPATLVEDAADFALGFTSFSAPAPTSSSFACFVLLRVLAGMLLM